jgi:hypothetical protein
MEDVRVRCGVGKTISLTLTRRTNLKRFERFSGDAKSPQDKSEATAVLPSAREATKVRSLTHNGVTKYL